MRILYTKELMERKTTGNSIYPKGGVYFRAASRSYSADPACAGCIIIRHLADATSLPMAIPIAIGSGENFALLAAANL